MLTQQLAQVPKFSFYQFFPRALSPRAERVAASVCPASLAPRLLGYLLHHNVVDWAGS